jgi:hypothetical protein
MNNFIDPPQWSQQIIDDVFEMLRRDGCALLGDFPSDELLTLARSLGVPKSDTRSADVAQDLVPRTSFASKRNTLSSRYGTAPFPLHTEAAYWSVPPRYLILLWVVSRQAWGLGWWFPKGRVR